MNTEIKRQNYTNEKAVERLKFNHLKKIEELKGIHKEGILSKNIYIIICRLYINIYCCNYFI